MGEKVGILVKTVGILVKMLGFSKLGLHESAWELCFFVENMGILGKNDGIWVKNLGILGVSTQESIGRSSFWGKKWEFWLKLLGF